MTDRLGSVRATTDPSGSITGQYSYDAWGTPTGTAGSYGFTGEPQTTAGGGLLYLRARWYRPGSARFLTTDSYAGSATTPASLHRYLYGADDPVDNTDPLGLCNDWSERACNDAAPAEASIPCKLFGWCSADDTYAQRYSAEHANDWANALNKELAFHPYYLCMWDFKGCTTPEGIAAQSYWRPRVDNDRNIMLAFRLNPGYGGSSAVFAAGGIDIAHGVSGFSSLAAWGAFKGRLMAPDGGGGGGSGNI